MVSKEKQLHAGCLVYRKEREQQRTGRPKEERGGGGQQQGGAGRESPMHGKL
eukprot:CAMPEP_0117694096 /NCGR_PEP_ID=MMETSP0804-20121206/27250_1 /TAXON_ID=1074897 /ORGANISM="Tetraselmis astigmatica, Strain CCMP880" /LENGTH=51 /DNA_ID=CAMNT_0005507731 /DNA_START=118 /DNA_END=273 /DNA_ORIENTATION=+